MDTSFNLRRVFSRVRASHKIFKFACPQPSVVINWFLDTAPFTVSLIHAVLIKHLIFDLTGSLNGHYFTITDNFYGFSVPCTNLFTHDLKNVQILVKLKKIKILKKYDTFKDFGLGDVLIWKILLWNENLIKMFKETKLATL